VRSELVHCPDLAQGLVLKLRILDWTGSSGEARPLVEEVSELLLCPPETGEVEVLLRELSNLVPESLLRPGRENSEPVIREPIRSELLVRLEVDQDDPDPLLPSSEGGLPAGVTCRDSSVRPSSDDRSEEPEPLDRLSDGGDRVLVLSRVRTSLQLSELLRVEPDRRGLFVLLLPCHRVFQSRGG
jgi:hypothetical protein